MEQSASGAHPVGERDTGELRALVRAEDLRSAAVDQRGTLRTAQAPIRAEKNPLHRQLANLRVQIPDRRLVLAAALRSGLREHLVETPHRLPLPGAHLVRVHLVARGERLADELPVAAARI